MAVLVVLLLVAVFAYLIWALVVSRKVPEQFALGLPWAPESAAVHLTAQVTPVMQDYAYHLNSQGPAAVVFSNTYRPMWLAIPCIFLFPIGLLFLLHRKTVDVSFNVVPVGGAKCTVQVTGKASRPFWEKLHDRLNNIELASPMSQQRR